MDLDNWPSVPGRYYVGNRNSCVVVCTLSSIDLLENFNRPEYLENIALVGKDVTEKVGIEKIVQNLTREQVESFRRQVKIVDLIGCEDIPTILVKAAECERSNPGIFEGGVKMEEVKTIFADYDPNKEVSGNGSLDIGWFNIFIERQNK